MKRMIPMTALALLAFAGPMQAAGELMVHPTRLVFEGNTRTAQVDLINSGTEPMTYRISLVRRRMTETGDFVSVDAPLPGEQFAEDMIRFSPRQVVLKPGIAQAVRLQLRKPAELAEGEYRTHLLFQALPPASAKTAGNAIENTDSLNIELTAIYSVSIPLIVRQGVTAATISLSDLALRQPQGGPPALAMTLHREGSRSVYGDLSVRLTTPQGVERVVGRANGIAVYTPNPSRRILLLLPALQSGIPPGSLRVTFAERPEQKGRIETEVLLPVR